MRVCVVGGGIIGLSSALFLKRNGPSDLTVKVLTAVTTPDTTGDGAAGIWGPYLLDETPVELQHRWAKETHDFVESLWNSSIGGSVGVSLVSSTRLNLQEFPPNWHDVVHGFRSLSQKELDGLGRHSGKHSHGYEFVTYTIEPVKLLHFFLKEFISLGGEIVTNVEVKDLAKLDNDFDLVINCTGVGAHKLANDPKVTPLRGQVMRVKAPWIHRVILDDTDDGNYVIPNQDTVVLGGTHQKDWNKDPSDVDREFILSGCKRLMNPALERAEFVRDWVGLRPGRPAVRLEREKLRQSCGRKVEVIHNYGHGGSGITIFWGCAKDVFKLAMEVHKEKSSKLMSKL